ncbi:Crp/Fnr family transcriptional regulator [Parafilimonas sp.]|uniref:Crp/Fnr family transcriptional regulator n=1 Tax=Parafilimonas sp. TaxID=1969739 RepID=UPI0039E2F9CA
MFQQIKAYYRTLVPAITDKSWNAMEECLIVQHLKKGDFFVRKDEICRHVCFINSGLMRLFYLEDGKEICTAFIRENNFISEYASFLTHALAAQYMEALEDCELVNLSFTNMQNLYKQHPVFEIFGRKIAEHLYLLLSKHNTILRAYTPEQRYYFLLDEEPELIQRVPQYMIASFIGVTPEHLSHIRNKR